MDRLGRALLVVAVWTAVVCHTSLAENTALRGAGAGYVVRWWTESDGLPETPLTGVVVAADGAVICASRSKVVRFDGHAFEPYPAPVIGPISDSIGTFFGIAFDRSHKLWIRGERGVAWILADSAAPNGWQTGCHFIEPSTIFGMACGGNGEMLFIGPGTLRIHEGGRIVHLPVDRSDPSATSWKYGDVDPSTGDLWLWGFFRQGRTLHRTRLPPHGEPLPPALVDDAPVADAVVTMAMAATGPVALLTDGLVARRDGRWKRLGVAASPSERTESGKLAVATDGAIWVSRHQGLAVYHDDRFETVVEGLPGFSFFTRGLVGDTAGGVWAACDGGLVAVRSARLQFTKIPGCQTIHVRSNGDVLAGVPGGVVALETTNGGGDFEWPGSTVRRMGDLPPGAMPTAILEEESGRIWVGTEDHYLFRLDDSGVTRITRENDRFRELRTITALAQDTSGVIWAGSSNGVARKDSISDEFTLVTARSDALGEAVIGLAADPTGGVLCATLARGVERLDAAGGRAQVLPPTSLPGRRNLAVERDTNGTIWVGGDQGLVRVAIDGAVARLTLANGLIEDAVREIFDDSRGRLWLATRSGKIQGVRLADLESVAAGRVKVVRGIVVGRHDGLGPGGCPGSFSKSLSPSAADSLTTIAWTDGFVRFDPLTLPTPAATPLPQVSREGTAPAEFAISVAGLHWGEPLLFQSRLHGVDSGWSQPTPERRRVYASLPPGDHVLEVRTVAGETERDFATAALAIETPEAWWQSPILLAIGTASAVAASAAGAGVVTRYRARRTIARLEREQEMNRERTRIARDIHDVLGAGLTRVALASDLARHSEIEPGPVSERFDSIYKNARALARALDEIVWAVNPQNDTLGDFISYAVNDIEESLEVGDLTLHLKVPDLPPDDRPLEAHVRHHLCLAVREAITNILRHAHATHVDVLITTDRDTIMIRIEDDGIGMAAEPAEPHAGNGVANIRSRVGALRGQVTFEAASTGGTVVTLRVPLERRRAGTLATGARS